MTSEITFAIDYNLGLAATDPLFQEFFAKRNVNPILYKNMKILTQELEENKVQIAYYPAANYFYFKNDSSYVSIANSLYAANKSTKIGSLLIVSKNSSIHSLAQLRGKCLGYVHPYCTNSFFAPALLLHRNNFSIHNFFSSMREVGAWQLQIDAVMAGKVDATMVEEDVWYKLPKNAEHTKIISRVDNLPSPVVVCSTQLSESFIKDFQKVLFAYQAKVTSRSLYNGFIPYQKEQMEEFFNEASQSFAYGALATSAR